MIGDWLSHNVTLLAHKLITVWNAPTPKAAGGSSDNYEFPFSTFSKYVENGIEEPNLAQIKQGLHSGTE